MNFIINILNKIIIIINRFIDSFDKKTVNIIKTSFYGFVFILVIIGIYIGYNMGKGSARKFGKPLTEDTNTLFDFSFKKSRERSRFKSLLESELIEEKADKQLKKTEFPANETIKTELDTKIIEPASDIKKQPLPFMDNKKIADVDKTDDKFKKSEVRELQKEIPKLKMTGKTVKENRPIDPKSKIIDK
ncbi:MAG: hypothetical protein V1874_00715 [Spirochaetota bacterium]